MKMINKIQFYLGFFSLFCFVLYIAIFDINISNYSLIQINSVLGIFLLVYCLLTWHQCSGKWFDLYTICLVFMFLFTYGQCFMWALGIHSDTEIGKSWAYGVGTITPQIVYKTQLLTLISILMFHCGCIWSYKSEKKVRKKNIQEREVESYYLFRASIIATSISTPLKYYVTLSNAINTRIYGYGSNLYNPDVVNRQNNIVILLSMMYFPALVGLLISSNYNKWVIRFTYINIIIFSALSALSGSRGEWIYAITLLIYMHHVLYRKINIKRFLLYILLAIFIINIGYIIRVARLEGMSMDAVRHAFLGESHPIRDTFFEMGGTMIIPAIILRNGWGSYPYGNTYILALLGMFTEKGLSYVIPGYSAVGGWFSHSYLGLSFGAGFSFVAEALMNFGPYIGAVFIGFLGLLLGRFVSGEVKPDGSPISNFFSVSITYCIVRAIRNTSISGLKIFIFSTLLIYVIYFALKNVRLKKLYYQRNFK